MLQGQALAAHLGTPRRPTDDRGPQSRVLCRPCYNSPVMGTPPKIAARRWHVAGVGLTTLTLVLALVPWPPTPVAAQVRSVLRPAEHGGIGPGTASLPTQGPRWQTPGTAVPSLPPDRSRRRLPCDRSRRPRGHQDYKVQLR